MEFDKLIRERYSVRSFSSRPLSQSDIDEILKAGHVAPTGCNFQPQRILVLNNENSMEKLRPCTKYHFNAPSAMLVCYNEDESWTRPYDNEKSAKVDAVIVATHMLLKAHEIGVGCCWVMHFIPDMIKQTFNLPKNVIPSALLIMGYPSETAKPSHLHDKFRPLEDVVFYDKF